METQTEKREIEIDIKQLIAELLKRIWIIVLVTFIVGLLALIASMFFLKPSYQSTTSVYILSQQSGEAGLSVGDVQLATSLTSDYEQLIKSRGVLDTVISDLGLTLTAQDLKPTITVSIPTGTRMLDISVMNGDPYMAQKIADKVREIAGKQIVEIMSIDAVNLVDKANLPLSPASPNITRNTLLGAVIGFLLACAAIILAYVLNDTIRKPEDIENFLGLSVLGIIPASADEVKKPGLKRNKKTKYPKKQVK